MTASVPAREIVFLSGARTGFGTFGGTLKGFSATDLGVFASKEALARSGVEPGEVDHVGREPVFCEGDCEPGVGRSDGARAGGAGG